MGDRRIVLLGKTGAGKSSLANTICGGDVFTINHTFNSETKECQRKNKSVDKRSITLVDTPDFFAPDVFGEELRKEIVKCIIECAPGPHVFLILLKVEKFTPRKRQFIEEILKTFSERVFKYAAVVFTHGDQLPEGMKIEEFVQQNDGLSDLVKKCGGRCHVIDNKHWKNNQQDEYRSNQFQVAELLKTIDKIVEKNNGHCYTNEMLQTVDIMIQKNGESNVLNILKTLAGITTGALLGALLGVPVMIGSVVNALMTAPPAEAVGLTVNLAGVAAGGGTTGLAIVAGCATVAGAVVGGYIGYKEAGKADSVWEAVVNTAKSVCDKAQQDVFTTKKQQQSEEKESLL